MSDAIVAGHICLDIVPRFQVDRGSDPAAYLTPGRLTEVGPAELYAGGAVPNAGINLHRLGIRTQLVGRIGDDLLGRAILEAVNGHDPELGRGMITVPGERSSYTLVIDPPGVDRMFLHDPGPNRTFGVRDIRYDLLAGARHFHFGYPPLLARMYADGGRELAEVFRRAKEMGTTTSLDLAMPDPAGKSGQADWPGILERALPHVDLFLPSVEELTFMLDRKRFDEQTARAGAGGVLPALSPAMIASLADETLAMGAKIVLLKMGTRGLYLRTAERLSRLGRGRPTDLAAWTNRQLWAPCFRPGTVASSVGTGDAAIAGFLAALLRDRPPELCLNVSAAAGACCAEVEGALGGVRTWEGTLARIRAGWDRLPLDLKEEGWLRDTEAGVWHGPAELSPAG